MIAKPIPHDEATKYVKDKPAVTRRVWDALHPDLQARAFTISGVECLDAIARVRDLAGSLPSGGDYDDLKSQILANISPWLVDLTADDETQTKQRGAARRRAELLLRLHGWQAYAQVNYQLAEANADVFPFRQYLTSDDGRVRPSHAALNKKVLPANHPFWQNHTPPWEFNCRCDFVVLTQEDADDMRKADAKKPPEDQRVLPPAQLDEIRKNNRIVQPGAQGFMDLRTPREKGGGKGYEYRPGDNALPLEQILERFTDADRATFENWSQTVQLAGGKTLADYWGVTAKPAPVRSQSAVSGKLSPSAAMASLTNAVTNAIDGVHTDGPLPTIPVESLQSPRYAGLYHYGTSKKISIKPSGSWPELTAAHEIGHFLDHMGIGTPGEFESKKKDGILKDVIAAAKKSEAFKNIGLYAPKSKHSYYRSPEEIWARAYAQYIAKKSGNAAMQSGLDLNRSWINYTQWSDDDFLPIEQAIDEVFSKLGWLNNSPTQP